MAWGFFQLRGYLIGVLIVRESYYLGVYIERSLFFVNPHVGCLFGGPNKGILFYLGHKRGCLYFFRNAQKGSCWVHVGFVWVHVEKTVQPSCCFRKFRGFREMLSKCAQLAAPAQGAGSQAQPETGSQSHRV